jgi:hypothetical protein
MTKTINPYSNRLIKVGGPTYNRFISDNDLMDNLFRVRCSPRNRGDIGVIYSDVDGRYYRLTGFSNIRDKCRLEKVEELKYEYNSARSEIFSLKEYTFQEKKFLVEQEYNKYCLAIIDDAWST